MIGQQLDLFGGPLRPPKKIKVDEQPEAATTPEPISEAEPVSENPPNIHAEMPDAISVAADAENNNAVEAVILVEDEVAEPIVLNETAVEETGLLEIEDEISDEQAPSEEDDFQPSIEPIEAIDEIGITNGTEVIESITDPVIKIEDSTSKTESQDIQQVAFRGRRTGDPEEEMEMLNVPPDEELFKRQYYSMRETAAMFNVNQALLRFWENEFDILQPKKNKKGDRYFRPVDVKNLVLIYHLLRVRKFTMEGAKDYLNTHKKAGDSFQLVQRLEKLKSFLLELKANL